MLFIRSKIFRKKNKLAWNCPDNLIYYTTNKIQKILLCLHFPDNSNYDATDSAREKLFKVKDIAEFLFDPFKTVYISYENFYRWRTFT